jgi:hypothetical protein
MKRSLVCVLSILALAVALPLLAQTERSVSGRVVSSSSNQLVIQTDDGRQMTFNVDSQSTGATGLTEGSRVTVRYHEMSGGTFHAANVMSAGATTGTTATDTSRTGATTDTSRTGATTDTSRTGATTSTGAYPERSTRERTTSTAAAPEAQQPNPPESNVGTSAANEPTTRTTGTREGAMPATASPLPLVGLSGLLALSGALGVRALRRRTS